MRDLVSCFGEHAVKVSDSYCSGSSSSPSPSSHPPRSSVLSAVASLYSVKLSSHKRLLINLTWSKNPATGPSFSISVSDAAAAGGGLASPIRKKRGSRSFDVGASRIDAAWDLSSAKYGPGPEPISDYHVAVVVDGKEYGLLLGDLYKDPPPKRLPCAESAMVARRERVVSLGNYSTKARFCDLGLDHEITIRCREQELSMFVDRKRAVHVENLQWNFRGCQTLFVEGLPVDVMWDVHDWYFNASSEGRAVVLFRRRSELKSRLWMEEKVLEEEEVVVEETEWVKNRFSLLIHACKSFP
ncbi:hypothetical protein QJS10_CPA02g00650 [Acorus calamus]|uniref:DUF868 domain-containing protein n=1 Tax=Acorus calamus TaxID=4465 RepID=A0AAV9FDH0_ACOCL|nr:hypothetical protein QJS10_CPA02g00650 [Acorus calamus]